MSRFFYILLVLFLLTANVSHVSAQFFFTPEERVKTIFDSMEEKGLGKGSVVIRQSDAIRNMVGARQYGANVEKTDGEAFLKLQGYRVQVFIGNSQRTAKSEAMRKEKEIQEYFSGLATYVTYTAPFWKLRVGDYRSYDEADQTLRQLKENFPSYAKEMTIVKEEIRIPLY